MPFVVALTDLVLPLYPAMNLSAEKRGYSSRLTRARLTVESAFGIFAHKRRIFYRPFDGGLLHIVQFHSQ